jgi:hypothetical protein
MNKAILVAALFMLAPLPAFAQEAPRSASGEAKEIATPSKEGEREDFLNRLSKTALRERLARAVEVVGRACSADIEELCGDVPPGGGRIARCLKENEDDLSTRCRVALYVVSRRIANNVRNITSACWSDVQSQCGEAENIRQCVIQKKESFSPACQTVVAALRETAQAAMAALKGMPVYSADDRNLGQVVEVTRGPDGKVQSVQIQIGRFLGIGDKVVTIDANQLQRLADRIKLRLDSDQVRALPQARRTQ